MSDLDLIRRITIQTDATPVDKLSASFDKLGAAEQRAAEK
jgi:hypothetical protein